MKKLFNRRNMFILFAGYFLFVSIHVISFVSGIKREHDDTLQLNEIIVDSLVKVISTSLSQANVLVNKIMENRSVFFTGNTDLLYDNIESILHLYPDIAAAGVAFSPGWIQKNHVNSNFALQGDHYRVSAYIVRDSFDNFLRKKALRDYTDNSDSLSGWYTVTASLKKPVWVGPYFDQEDKMECVDYCVPMYDITNDLICIVFATYTVQQFQSFAADSAKFTSGYSFLVSQSGTFLYHPRKELVDGKYTLRDVGLNTGNSTLLACADSVSKGVQSGKFKYSSIYTKETTDLVYQRIDELGWYLMTVAPDKLGQPLCSFPVEIFTFLIEIMVLIFLGLCVVRWGHLWSLSIGLSLIFTAGIIMVSLLSVKKYESGLCSSVIDMMEKKEKSGNRQNKCSRTALENVFAASAYINTCFSDTTIKSFPVGLVVQTINFTGSNSFSMSGYIWQKYSSRSDTSLLGIEFPENESAEFQLLYDDSSGINEYVRTWHFSTTIRQPFGYKKYPLDKEEMWLRMRPNGLIREVRLVPDYKGYRTGSTLPMGIDQNLVLPQWTIMSTNFSFDVNYTPSNYGRNDCDSCHQNLELYFSLHIRRNILDAFISQFIPLLVIILMLFSILWVGRKLDEKGLLGFNSLSGTSGCSALFFVVIYNHISIRNQLGSPGVVYMEYYFFVAYLAILLVSLNSIMVALDYKSKLINHQDNLLSRLIYWPLITGSLFVVTFLMFFRG